jgi:two-component system, NarL family, nitrate/nitrite response regulator NarP
VVYAEDTGDIPRKAMAAGAAGFVSRSESVDRLLETCVAVAKGQMVFPFLDIRNLKQDPIEALSPRERTLLQALSTGMTNRELAKELEISENTVKFHLSNLFEKLAVKNRAQAIAFFYANRASRGEM